MKTIKLLLIFFLLLLTGLPVVNALEVDREVVPRITLGGRLISTYDVKDKDSDPAAHDNFNLSDSSLLLRFDKRMYEDGVAGAVIGFTEHESTVAFHQLNAFYWNRNYGVTMGRGRLHNTLLEFPLLRDDDLLDYTHVGNASSNEEFYQIYAEQLSLDWFVDQKLQMASIWAAARGEDDVFVNAPKGIDSYGFSYVIEQSEDRTYVEKIRHAGLLLDVQKINKAGKSDRISSFIAGVEFNLNADPTANWSMGLQLMLNNGSDTTGDLLNVSSRASEKSNTFVSSVRYTGRPQLLTRWQSALTLAYKDYPDFSDASQLSLVPNFVYRIGQATDVFAQLAYTDFGEGLGGGSDTVIQFGIAFSLEAMFNDNIGERDSILNLEHGYIQ